MTTDALPNQPRATEPLDLARIRDQFPVLRRRVGDRPLVYLDSAATTQKPQAVLDAVENYYARHNANVHRGVHRLSVEATEAFEAARAKAVALIGGGAAPQGVFVRGTTEALNLVAQGWARPRLQPGDEVLITWMEHHSNIVPWQMVCAQTGTTLKVVPITDDGSLRMGEFAALLNERTKVVAVTHISNALGTINPLEEITAQAHAAGAIVVVDGAQAAAHLPVDVRELGVDFYAYSAHKTFGPTGVGLLWGKMERLEEMSPWMGGGDMIRSVSFEKTTYADIPSRFEAGTPNIAGAIGFGAAIDWLQEVGVERIRAHEDEVLAYGEHVLREFGGVRLIGTAPHRTAVLSFVMEGAHPHDVGTILDQEGVAVRTGHHCAQPVMERFRVPATIRASLSVYNGKGDLDRLVEALASVRKIFG